MEKYQTVDGVKCKLCSTCKEYVPMNAEKFSKRSASSDGFAYSCKACERETSRKSYERRKKNKRTRDYYAKNKEKLNEQSKQRYQENKDAILEQQKVWRGSKKGKAVMKKSGDKRRQRIADQTPGGKADYVRADVVKRDTNVKGEVICGICSKPIDIEAGELHIDHIISINDGGPDLLSNVRCTHRTCNLVRAKSDVA